MSYPISDSTTSDLKKVLFPPGVTLFAEDFQTIESYREMEEIQRWNSIVKTPGIVSKKATEVDVDTTKRKLFPIGITANQIVITSGVGFTGNGARIYLPTGLSITDVSSITGYTDPSAFVEGTGLYLVLRKTIYQYATRTHPITGELKNTRQEILYNNSIVEFINDLTTIDRDVIVLGRLTNNGVSVTPIFDTTELTGGRKILRITEALTCETTGFVMEGDIDMYNRYQVKNLPQWGSTYWTKEGSVYNNDFRKLFAKTNYTFQIIGGVKFTVESGIYGIKFTSGTYPIKIFPYQKPPNKISISNDRGDRTVKSIPANQLMYIELTENEAGVGTTNMGDLVVSLSGRGLLTSIDTFNNGIAGNLLRFPIAYNDNNQRLIFPNGVTLLLEEEIDSDGKYSGYVRRDGGNIMSGDLKITKTNPYIWLTGSGGSGTDNCGFYILNSLSTGARLWFMHSASADTATLSLYNSGGVLKNHVIFTNDGRMQLAGGGIQTANNDVITLGYALGSSGWVKKSGDTMVGTLNILGSGNLVVGSSSTTPDRVEPRAQIYGDVRIYSNSAGKASLVVDGTANIKKSLRVDGNSSLYGNLVVGSSETTPSRIEPRAQIYGDVRIYSDSANKASLIVDGTAYIQKSLRVDGETTFYNNIYIGDNATHKQLHAYVNAYFKTAVVIESDTLDGGTLLLHDNESSGVLYTGTKAFDVSIRIKNNRTKSFFFAN